MESAGRAPNTKRLNLQAVGVELDRVGAVKVKLLPYMLYMMFTSNSCCLATPSRCCLEFCHTCLSIMLFWLYPTAMRWQVKCLILPLEFVAHKFVLYLFLWDSLLEVPHISKHIFFPFKKHLEKTIDNKFIAEWCNLFTRLGVATRWYIRF